MMNHSTKLFALSLAMMGLAGLGTATAQVADSSQNGRDAGSVAEADFTSKLIIKLRVTPAHGNAMNAARLGALSAVAGLSLTRERGMSGGAEVLRLPRRMAMQDATAVARQLSALPNVEYAVPDRRLHAMALPNDTQFVNQWHYKAPSAEPGGVNLPAAWDVTTGAPGIVIALIDTGMVLSHADLAGRTVPGYDFISDSFIANDGDGRDANPGDPGDWNTAEQCGLSGPRNSSWHGTHVAGTLGAASNNAQGVAGVNWLSKIQPVRVLGRCGGDLSDIIDAMRWAAGLNVPGVPDNVTPARALNLSLGGPGACDAPTQSAVNDIVNAGAVVVVAAGNSAINAVNSMPGNCSGVITVYATSRAGGRTDYSNFGASIEISAPGGQRNSGSDLDAVLSTLNTGRTSPAADDYRYYQGTSMATPHVTGIVSLILSANPALTPTQVLANIQSTARAFPTGSGNDCNTFVCGPGIINAAAAVARGSRVLKANPAGLSFPVTPVGQTAAARTLTFMNTNSNATSLTLGVAAITGAHAGDFAITANTCHGAVLPPQATCSMGVNFQPGAAGSRTANVTLPGNAVNAPLTLALTGTATSAASTLQFSAATYFRAETFPTAVIRITRAGSSAGAVSVNYTASGGTASAGVDYSAVSGVVNFANGQTSKTFSVPLINDTLIEATETVNLSLSNASGAALGTQSSAVLTISSEDIGLRFSAAAYSRNEGAGTATIAVRRVGGNGAVTVNYATADGSAMAGADYTATAGVLNFAQGDYAQKTFTVPITNDALDESNETVNLSLSNPSSSVQLVAPANAALTLVDND